MMKNITLLPILISSLLANPITAAPVEVPKYKQPSQDFTTVAREATPAVVSIRVKSTGRQKSGLNNPWWSDEDSNDAFNDDFLQRFFGFQKRNQDPQPIQGQASGFIVSPDGHILTNNHVVKDANEIIVVTNDGKEYTGKILGQDDNTDIAVIKIDIKNAPYLKLGDSDDLEVGQWVVAIGNPMGLQASLTVGVVSAKGRNDLDLTRIEDFIQTDAAINRGNSGGPLLTLDGQVAGMNTAIVTSMATGGYMGIGFAIPSNMLKHVMEELLSNGSISRGFLGVTLQQLDSGLAKAFGLDKVEGAVIADVTKGSPAEKAGLKQGDIILKYNNHNVINIATLRNAISLMKPGANVTLSVMRDGKVKNYDIVIAEFPKEGSVLASAKENKYGFQVQTITPEIAQGLSLSDEKGVIISKVEPGTPAAWAGLRKGTVIVGANNKKIANAEEFQQALEATEKGKPFLLLIKQGNQVRYLSLQVNN